MLQSVQSLPNVIECSVALKHSLLSVIYKLGIVTWSQPN